MNLIRIDTLFNYEKGSLQSSKNVSGKYNFITASVDWKTHREYSHETEALVFAAAAAGSLGRTHYVNGKFIASDLCFILTPKDPENYPIDLRFYHIIFNELRKDIVKNTKSGTSKEAIGLSSFGKYEIPYFEINQQIDIKSKYVASEGIKNELTSEFTHQLDLLKKLRQQILQNAVQGKLVPQDPNDEPASVLLERIKAEKEKLFREKKIKKEKALPPIKPEEIPFEIPDSWVWCRLGDLSTDLTYGTSVRADDFGDIPVLRMGNITMSGEILYSNLKYVKESISDLPKLFLKKYDLIFNRTNSFELVGKCAVYDKDDKYTLASYLIRVRFLEDTCSKYISRYINSKICRETQIEPDTIQQNGQANFNGTKLSKILIPLPPLCEQRRIINKIDQLIKFCNDLEQNIQQKQEYTQELMQMVLKEALEIKHN
jgi:type I restriction enzyme S subunit